MEILESLRSQGLIERSNFGKRKVYVITEKGLNVVRFFEKAEDLLAIEKIPEA